VVGWLRAAGCEGAAVVETGDAVTASGCPERLLTPTALAEVVEFVHVVGLSRVETAGTSHAATTTGRDQVYARGDDRRSPRRGTVRPAALRCRRVEASVIDGAPHGPKHSRP
jgi:hypothetical protein